MRLFHQHSPRDHKQATGQLPMATELCHGCRKSGLSGYIEPGYGWQALVGGSLSDANVKRVW